MPELPDVLVYVERLEAVFAGKTLSQVRVVSPFVLRTVEPPLAEVHGKRLTSVGRMGKRLVLAFEDELHLVIHLMIAGRLKLRNTGAPVPKKLGLARFDFSDCEHSLLFTEASKKKRASLHVVRGDAALAQFDRGGLDLLRANKTQFHRRITAVNHTLKRALTDPSIVDGVGNAYSDEILHRAQMSPFTLTKNLSPDESAALLKACKDTLREWIVRLRAQVGEGFPEKVTAFHPDMAVHGRYKLPCPRCGAPVQRIVYAANEANYCARCQTAGKIMADRSLSRLLKENWPRTLEELEERMPGSGVVKGGSPDNKSE